MMNLRVKLILLTCFVLFGYLGSSFGDESQAVTESQASVVQSLTLTNLSHQKIEIYKPQKSEKGNIEPGEEKRVLQNGQSVTLHFQVFFSENPQTNQKTRKFIGVTVDDQASHFFAYSEYEELVLIVRFPTEEQNRHIQFVFESSYWDRSLIEDLKYNFEIPQREFLETWLPTRSVCGQVLESDDDDDDDDDW